MADVRDAEGTETGTEYPSDATGQSTLAKGTDTEHTEMRSLMRSPLANVLQVAAYLSIWIALHATLSVYR